MQTIPDKLKGVSRRDMLRISGQFGLSSTLIAAAGLTGAITAPQLAEAGRSVVGKRPENMGSPAAGEALQDNVHRTTLRDRRVEFLG